MDYEKKYKEVLKKIREGLQPSPDGTKISGVTREFLEEVFPELKESEDENFIGCVACIYQDSCSSLQFGQGCTDGKEANRG